jgi:ABC-2 type transport system ATP-binding protein
VFFSSHVLSDAEALCSRVAIVASGRLVAQGALSELLAFQIRGWEIVVHRLSTDALAALEQGGHVVEVTPVGEGRYSLRVDASTPIDQVSTRLWQGGAEVVSLVALRDSLEDFFVRQVAATPTARGLEGSGS